MTGEIQQDADGSRFIGSGHFEATAPYGPDGHPAAREYSPAQITSSNGRHPPVRRGRPSSLSSYGIRPVEIDLISFIVMIAQESQGGTTRRRGNRDKIESGTPGPQPHYCIAPVP